MIASGGRGGVESKESVDSTGLGGDNADIVTVRERERKKKEREEGMATRRAACLKRGREREVVVVEVRKRRGKLTSGSQSRGRSLIGDAPLQLYTDTILEY